ncbi:MAG TPA: dihydrolipoamide acetyltransferase family protein, partial [Conexivisphaerales archaeon]|nr:dihydrolipoamide acetyltransferase family protein [Conexivisphaerales archaeon]
PRLSDSMEEGTILTWLKQEGDEVAVGEELVEIETDKANMAYEADVAGTLTKVLAKEGETLPIGSPIAVIGDPGEGPSAPSAGPVAAGDPPPPPVAKASSGVVPPTAPPAEGAEASTPEGPSAPAKGEDGARVKASPVARRLASEQGIDLSSLAGSGPGGRIVKRDVKAAAGGARERAAVAPAQAPAPDGAETAKGQVTVEELSKLQQVVARRMSESKATAPHFYLDAEIDMGRAVEARARLKASASEGDLVPSFNDMVIKACALALREFPRANGSYKDGRFELYSRINVGVAVAAQDALVVPTVFDADKKGLRQIAEDSRQLAERVREGSITPPELSGGTFTVSNLGMFGIDSFSAVINSP